MKVQPVDLARVEQLVHTHVSMYIGGHDGTALDVPSPESPDLGAVPLRSDGCHTLEGRGGPVDILHVGKASSFNTLLAS